MHKQNWRQIVIFSLWVFPLLLWLDGNIRPISEPDLFFYFALIKVYLRDGVWPTTDPFLYSLPHEPLTSLHQWLGYWFYYLPYSWFGWTGPILVKTVVTAAVFLIPLIPFWRRGKDIPFYYPLFWLLSIFTSHHRFRERVSEFGDLFTVFLVAGLLWWTEQLWFWIVLPPLFLLWAQVHPSYPMGWVILLGYMALRKGYRSRPAVISTVLCLAAPFLNPEGVNGALYPIYFARDIAPYLRQYVVEWLPLTDSRLYVFRFLYIPLITIVPWMLFRFARAWREVSIFEWLLLVLAITLNFNSVRFGLVAQGLYLCLLTNRELQIAEPWRPGKWTLGYTFVVCLTIFAFKFGNSTNHLRHFSDRLDIDRTYFPDDAVTALNSFHPKLRILNSFGFGGYLAFRWLGDPPIFFHGFSTNFKFFEDYYNKPQENAQAFQDLIRKYDLGVFILSKLGNDNGFIHMLQNNKDWQKLREDMVSVIYVKRDPRVFGP